MATEEMNNDKDCIMNNKEMWCLRFAWLPHRCQLTGRWVWLDFGYHQQATHNKHAWHSEESHILWMLEGNN